MAYPWNNNQMKQSQMVANTLERTSLIAEIIQLKQKIVDLTNERDGAIVERNLYEHDARLAQEQCAKLEQRCRHDTSISSAVKFTRSQFVFAVSLFIGDIQILWYKHTPNALYENTTVITRHGRPFIFYGCMDCKRIFKNAQSLAVHEPNCLGLVIKQIYSLLPNGQPYVCGERNCDHTFMMPSEFKAHMDQHI